MEHFCTKHNTKFFKTNKMKTYAHPISGTDEWCSEVEPFKKPIQGDAQKYTDKINTKQVQPEKSDTLITESSIAFKGCIELLSNGIISPTDELGKKTLKWANDRL